MTTTSKYDADTQAGEWFSPTTGERVLKLQGVDFKTAHAISNAIARIDKIAMENAMLQMHIQVERFMGTLSGVRA